MSIRKIRANHAEITGDYITIYKTSYRSIGFLAFFGTLFFGTLVLLPSADILVAFVVSITLAAVLCLMIPGQEIRMIPRVDLVEIKSYPNEHKVTVVLDDDRTKRRQPVTVKKE